MSRGFAILSVLAIAIALPASAGEAKAERAFIRYSAERALEARLVGACEVHLKQAEVDAAIADLFGGTPGSIDDIEAQAAIAMNYAKGRLERENYTAAQCAEQRLRQRDAVEKARRALR